MSDLTRVTFGSVHKKNYSSKRCMYLFNLFHECENDKSFCTQSLLETTARLEIKING